MGILVLAAGTSGRFGSDKRRAALASGEEILHQTMRNATGADFPVSLVLGPGDTVLAEELQKEFRNAEIIRCPEALLGIGHTLAFGIDHVRDLGWRNCLIAYGDMPWVTSPVFNAVGKRISADKIMVPRYQERCGRPVGFGRNFFAELAELRGESDETSVWRHHTDRVEYLELDDRSILDSVDQPEDLLKHI